MFGNLGGLGDIAKLMSLAKDFQGNMKSIQEEVGKREFIGNSGNGMVQAVVSGKMEIKKLSIRPEALQLGDAETVQDLVTAAVNNALAEAKAALKGKLQEMTGGLGLDLPGVF
ncbi:MAG: YbaB/EbfC family nucleoid-associated protein [Victivallales bacterium]|nr:YbaB/EbfC family nucleoid-associated protein [Victivallales bacterium]